MKRKIVMIMMAATTALLPLTFTTGCAITQGQENAKAYAKDKEIIGRIKATMYRDTVVKGTQVDVKSLNGIVQLSGFIESQEARNRAGDIAATTPGVLQVHNSLLLPTGR